MITREADYAIRVVLHLSRVYNEGPVSTTEIGVKMEIPYRFLRRITRQLAEAGFIETTRGKQGGIRLCVSPRTLSLLDILTVFDQKAITLNACFQDSGICNRVDRCEVHHHLDFVQDQLRQKLGELSFAHLLKHSFNHSSGTNKEKL